jgi:alpha/beta superfamily hydrolase
VTNVRSADGLLLEAEFDAVGPVAGGGVVICHAHPGMQGTMRSPLLLALRDELVARNWNVLRFNFRGVGSSEGSFGLGVAEVADALGAVEFLRAEQPGVPVVVAGWSFGGAVAIRTAAQADIAACAAIAPAVKQKPDVGEGVPADLSLTIPVLVVCGSNDEVVRPEDCRAWAKAVSARYEEIKAANHFFWAKYDAVVSIVVRFFEESVSGRES